MLDLVADEGMGRRSKARFLALGVNGVGVALMIVVFAHTGGLVGAEIGVAGGTAVLAQRVLEAVFGDQAVRRLAETAKEDLDARVQALMADELVRYHAVLDQIGESRGAGRDTAGRRRPGRPRPRPSRCRPRRCRRAPRPDRSRRWRAPEAAATAGRIGSRRPRWSRAMSSRRSWSRSPRPRERR